ncbi:MAG: hypothetical protein QQN55_01195 [Nitrosopumilus sp.]
MNYQKANGISIQEKFEQFNKENPLVYSLFKQQVLKAISKGKKKISAKTVLGFIRWETQFHTTGDEYKINDAFTSRYARKFNSDFPEHNEIFHLRNLRS